MEEKYFEMALAAERSRWRGPGHRKSHMLQGQPFYQEPMNLC